jgi:L-fuculose-phosphate aldolase
MEERFQFYRKLVAKISNRVGDLMYTTSHGGNISCRFDADFIAATPTKCNKRLVGEDEICIVRRNGELVYKKDGTSVTSEFPIHNHIYYIREDVNAVIHAHPPITTGLAIAHSDVFEKAILPESCMELGPVLSVPYMDPGSKELAENIGEAIKKTNAIIMQNHGVIVVSSEGLNKALEMLELLEVTATSLMVAQIFGKINTISDDNIVRISNLYHLRGIPVPGKVGFYQDASETFLKHSKD